jgi:hypothetical protein
MVLLWEVVTFIHLSGLVLGVGAATVKLALMLSANFDRTLVPAYLRVSKVITRFIVLGLVILTISGVVLLVLGAKFTPLLVAKLVMVAAVWGIGPFIDKAVEPKFARLAPAPGEEATPEFISIQKRYLRLEAAALFLFYVATVMGRMV